MIAFTSVFSKEEEIKRCMEDYINYVLPEETTQKATFSKEEEVKRCIEDYTRCVLPTEMAVDDVAFKDQSPNNSVCTRDALIKGFIPRVWDNGPDENLVLGFFSERYPYTAAGFCRLKPCVHESAWIDGDTIQLFSELATLPRFCIIAEPSVVCNAYYKWGNAEDLTQSVIRTQQQVSAG